MKPRSPEDLQMLTTQRIDGSHDLSGYSDGKPKTA